MGTTITGWGSALPDKVVTNADFASYLDTSDTWIVERTGIRERRFGGSTAGLAEQAARVALECAERDPATISYLLLATTTPDWTIPATSSALHAALGCGGGAFDLNAACAGFVYALVVADSLCRTTPGTNALVIGSDTLSRVTDQRDRATAVLFGDGAGAVVVEHAPGESLIVAHDLGVDGSAVPILNAPIGGTIYMEGREVYRRAVRAELNSITAVLETSGLGPEDLALFVPHQANVRIIEAVNERLGIPMEKTAIVLDRTGNTSAASIPFALCEAAGEGRIKAGDLVLLSGFGAGMTWASAIIRWGVAGPQA